MAPCALRLDPPAWPRGPAVSRPPAPRAPAPPSNRPCLGKMAALVAAVARAPRGVLSVRHERAMEERALVVPAPVRHVAAPRHVPWQGDTIVPLGHRRCISGHFAVVG